MGDGLDLVFKRGLVVFLQLLLLTQQLHVHCLLLLLPEDFMGTVWRLLARAVFPLVPQMLLGSLVFQP